MNPLIKNISSLILLVGLYVASYSAVMADEYIYEGNNFTIAATGAYDSTMNVTGTITTSVPIPDNSVDFDIGTIATSWTFFDGVQTIDNINGVFHPNSFLRPKFTTDGSGQITLGRMVVVKTPVAVTNTQFNDLIGIFPTLRDDAILQAPCITVTEGTCATYSTASEDTGFAPVGGIWTRSVSPPPPTTTTSTTTTTTTSTTTTTTTSTTTTTTTSTTTLPPPPNPDVGVPTLHQFGLALLALLMLGIGAVGFRRFF